VLAFRLPILLYPGQSTTGGRKIYKMNCGQLKKRMCLTPKAKPRVFAWAVKNALIAAKPRRKHP
jgi:hypothetical protein